MFETAIENLTYGRIDITAFDEHGQMIFIDQHRKWFRSIVVNRYPKICFTKFSALDDNYRHFTIQIRDITFEIVHKNEDYSHVMFGSKSIYFSIHSPNILPDFKEDQTFQKLSNAWITLVRYSEIHTTLLPSPYQTHCKTYELETNEQNMRSDCVMKCITDRIIKECDIKCVSPWNNYKPIRENNVHDYYDYPICDTDKFNQTMIDCVGWKQAKLEPKCEDQCLKNCYEIHYDFEVRKQILKKPWDVYGIKLIHDQHPDQIIEHRPAMTWLELVSSCGGLLGMWLGISFAFVFEHGYRILKRKGFRLVKNI